MFKLSHQQSRSTDPMQTFDSTFFPLSRFWFERERLCGMLESTVVPEPLVYYAFTSLSLIFHHQTAVKAEHGKSPFHVRGKLRQDGALHSEC